MEDEENGKNEGGRGKKKLEKNEGSKTRKCCIKNKG